MLTFSLHLFQKSQQLGLAALDHVNSKAFRDRSISKHLGELRAENKRLTAERERLRVVLCDREEDVRVMRTEMARRKEEEEEGSRRRKREEREQQQQDRIRRMVGRMEGLQGKYGTLKQDLQVSTGGDIAHTHSDTVHFYYCF